MRAAGWTQLTQSLHEQRQKSDINNICKSLGMSTRNEFFRIPEYALVRFIIYMLVESNRHW